MKDRVSFLCKRTYNERVSLNEFASERSILFQKVKDFQNVAYRSLRFLLLFVGFLETGCQTGPSLSEPFRGTFTKACSEGRLDLVKSWENPPLSEKDIFETTPLGSAVLRKDEAMAEFLLKRGADPNGLLLTDCIILRSALAQAYHENDERMIALLKRYGADLNHPDRNGQTDLHRVPLLSCETAKRLLRAGLDATAVDHEGRTVFFYLPSSYQMDAAEMEAFVKIFQKYGADINRPLPNGGETPYEKAIREKDFIKVRIFRENGAKLRHVKAFPIR